MGKRREPERTRSAILRAAYGEVYRRGFRAASIEDILAETDVTKGAFFHHFPSKSDLGYALVDEVLREVTLDRWIRPLAAYRNPVRGVARRFKVLMEETPDEDLAFGCPLNNLTQEMSPIDPVFRDKLRAVLLMWIDETEKQLRRAQADGYVKPGVDVRMAAEFIVMAEEGSAALVKSLTDRRIYQSLYEGFRMFLESISTRPL